MTLAEAKLFLRVDTTDEDSLITSLIVAARERAEQHTQRQLVTASYLFTCSNATINHKTGNYEVLLPLPPLASVESVQVTDTNGNVSTVNASTYRVVKDGVPGKIVFSTLPSFDATRDDAIKVAFTCGYGAAAAVPQGIKTAMYWMIAAMYQNREEADAPMNSSVERQLNLYRAWRVGN